ncbi:hypothetical protein [Anaerococcus lactolyticus]|nr:hypothetical protein [Anaerococcus lactolyticus]
MRNFFTIILVINILVYLYRRFILKRKTKYDKYNIWLIIFWYFLILISTI